MSLLATKLGEKEYFFGQSPSSLDAVVFAHLAPLLKAPLPSAALQNHLKACTNLTRFVGRVLQRFFPKEVKGISDCQCFLRLSFTYFFFSSLEQEQKERQQTAKQEAAYSDTDFPNKLRNISIAALVSFMAMIAYATSTGIIQVIESQ